MKMHITFLFVALLNTACLSSAMNQQLKTGAEPQAVASTETTHCIEEMRAETNNQFGDPFKVRQRSAAITKTNQMQTAASVSSGTATAEPCHTCPCMKAIERMEKMLHEANSRMEQFIVKQEATNKRYDAVLQEQLVTITAMTKLLTTITSTQDSHKSDPKK